MLCPSRRMKILPPPKTNYDVNNPGLRFIAAGAPESRMIASGLDLRLENEVVCILRSIISFATA